MNKITWLKILKSSLPHCILICVVFGLKTVANSQQGKIKIAMPNGPSMTVDIVNEQVKLQDIIAKIKSDSKEEKALLLELKDKNIYKISDDNLVDALEQEVRFPDQVAIKIRNLWQNSRGPFKYVDKVTIVVDPSLPEGKAHVCSSKDFLSNYNLRVLNKKSTDRIIDVEVDKHFACNEEEEKLNILKISRADGNNLAIKDLSKHSFAKQKQQASVEAIFIDPNSYHRPSSSSIN